MPNQKINEDFKKTCKLLFGTEVGELEEFAPYLEETLFPYKIVKSAASGKQVMMSSDHYLDDAVFASQEEVAKIKFAPLSINEIKDIDSLFDAASERAVYCGNKLFGKNMNVSEGDNISDCIEVRHSHDIFNSKYVAYCSIGRVSESIYGVNVFWKCNHDIRCAEVTFAGAARCFECYQSTGISDSYYTYNCSSCQDCMFSFNLRGKNHMIGNLQLARERYMPLKEKLVGEMAEKLKKDKRLFAMGDIAQMAGGKESGKKIEVGPGSVPKEVEAAFASTCRIVLGKEHKSGMVAPWLMSRAIGRKKIKGAGALPTYTVDSPLGRQIGRGELVTFDEAMKSASSKMELGENELPSLDEIAKRAAKHAYFSMEFREGQNQNTQDTVEAFNSTDVYRVWWSLISKHSAYSTVVTESEHIFGGWGRIMFSQFCIGCDNSMYASNSFESDSLYKCRNCYFSHNCENVEDGIFCFNAKGLRYAVCNTQVSKEEYARVKKMLLEYVNGKLERDGKLDVSAYNIGIRKASEKSA